MATNPLSHSVTDALVDRLLPEVTALRDEAVAAEARYSGELAGLDDGRRDSARNLIHYLTVRKHDIRQLQVDLLSLGLSSLGIIEPHVLGSLDRAIYVLQRLQCREPDGQPVELSSDLHSGPAMLRENAAALLGPELHDRSVRIMVTMPSEAASDPRLVEQLLRAGMNIMRINCAHDSPAAWQKMVENLRAAERRTGLKCRIQADLAGPKVRTGPIEPVGRVLKVRPRRDAYGRTLRPARVWIADSDEPAPKGSRLLPVSAACLDKLKVGDELRFRDTRGKRRSVEIVRKYHGGFLAEGEQTAYFMTGMPLKIRRDHERAGTIKVGMLPEVSEPIHLAVDDEIVLTRDFEYGSAAPRDASQKATGPARIHCTLPEAFDQVKRKQSVWFDDGKIGGVVRKHNGEEMRVRITHTGPNGGRLRAEKGINFPDTDLQVDALTQKDRRDLESVVGYADMVAMSFIRRPEDVIELQSELARHGAAGVGVVLKIENRHAFEELPRILLAAMRSPPVGVMVARGDLAVEVGFERLSEVQEEILWVCEAAHVPLIWATQVLEGLAKRGAPSRAEVTDAAASQRAECVMLNKGPHIVETTRFLSDVLSRMGTNYRKRRSTLRRLSIADSI